VVRLEPRQRRENAQATSSPSGPGRGEPPEAANNPAPATIKNKCRDSLLPRIIDTHIALDFGQLDDNLPIQGVQHFLIPIVDVPIEANVTARIDAGRQTQDQNGDVNTRTR
jgi:hypothetical protein